MTAGLWAAALAGLAGSALAGVRWLRVAQREHYLGGSLPRFGWRWWGGPGGAGPNGLLFAAGALATIGSLGLPAVGVVVAAVAAGGPAGLSLRGRTSKLVWTGRLARLAAVWGAGQLAVLAGSVVVGVEVGGWAGGGAALVGLFTLSVPLTVGLACRATAPLERRLADPFVRSAAERLARVGPTVVAITGSYGKTTTKGYVAHLLGTSRSVVASPASFNNRAGLARAVNEHLAVGTEVFVAEMGTYGPGEIAELCSWTRPAVAVITAIGPVHLERFGSEERIVEAKSEILAGARAIVLNVDDARLAAVAARAAGEGRRVWRCSGLDPSADVHVGVGGGEMAAGPPLAPCPPSGAAPEPGPVVTVRGRRLGCLAAGAPGAGSWAAPTNVACAVAVALELGVDPPEVARLLGSLPVAPNRLSVLTAGGGFTVLDDTYNSNPAGARLALAALEGAGTEGGRKVLVTPGMVELGRRQAAENEAFAAAARPVVTYLVVVGRTNRRALLLGIGAGDRASGDPAAEAAAGGRPGRRPQVEAVATREQAVAFVRAHLGPGDVVLYENDLPDHYP